MHSLELEEHRSQGLSPSHFTYDGEGVGVSARRRSEAKITNLGGGAGLASCIRSG